LAVANGGSGRDNFYLYNFAGADTVFAIPGAAVSFADTAKPVSFSVTVQPALRRRWNLFVSGDDSYHYQPELYQHP